MELRTATMDDLDSLTDIHCAAFSEDPQTEYLYTHRREYPQDYWRCTREMFKNLLTDSREDHYLVKVITARSNEDDSIVKPVALAAWLLQYLKETPFLKGMSDHINLVIGPLIDFAK